MNLAPYLACFVVDGHKLTYDGPEPQNEREALLITIAKWETVVLLMPMDNTPGALTDGNTETCGLCMYHLDIDTDQERCCAGCPVFEQRGIPLCLDTPYMEFHHTPNLENAQAEHNFLIGLYMKIYGGGGDETLS